MTVRVQVTFDCRDPERLAEFWAAALGYQHDWRWDDATVEWLRQEGVADEDMGSRSAISDPEGHAPRLYFQRVPEGKELKNRVHLDLHVGQERVEEEVARLRELGAVVVEDAVDEFGPFPPLRNVVMQDPEGNEFCVA